MEVAWCSPGRSERARLGVVARLPTTPQVTVRVRVLSTADRTRMILGLPLQRRTSRGGEKIECFVLVPSRVVQMTPSDALSFSSLFGHLGNSDCLNPPEYEKNTHDSGHHVDVLLQARGNRLDHGEEHRRKRSRTKF